ncbi:MAG: dihydrolipoyl dehydrogenase [Thermomicrobiales bacterium]
MSATAGAQPYDVVVIGGGPGGYVAAIRAAQLGLKAVVVEREELGGICLNWGCIPSKALLRNAEILSLFHHAKDYGIAADNITADYGAAMDRCGKIIATQVRGVNFLMRKNKIDVVRGTAKIVAKDRVAVTGGADGDKEIQAKNIIIATGSHVMPLQGVTVDGEHIISAKEIWRLKSLPKAVLIIGAGPIGLEFATVFEAYGCDVTIVEFLPRVLPREDEEMSAELAKQFTRRGMKILTNTKVDGATVKGDKVQVKLSPAPSGEGQPQTLEVDRVLLSAGFVPNSKDLGLEALGVATDRRGYITVDDHLRTNVPNIFAIGDVTGKLPLAHTAFAQAELVAELIAGQHTYPLDYDAIPRCTYSHPQVAALGLTEEQAREGGREIKVGKFPFRPNGKAQALGELDGQVKIIEDARTGEILGVHMVGPDVTEMIAEFALARTLEATPAEVARAVHPHPTLSEVIGEAAPAVEGLPIHM